MLSANTESAVLINTDEEASERAYSRGLLLQVFFCFLQRQTDHEPGVTIRFVRVSSQEDLKVFGLQL